MHTAIFDIGKTNKKLLIFNEKMEVVLEQEKEFNETVDDDGFPCDDLDLIEKWILQKVEEFTRSDEYDLKSINFATYGASVVYLDKDGKRITPLYNYLKKMPAEIPEMVYSEWGGMDEFCRKTASPPSGMLNAALQIKWIKESKPKLFSKIRYVLNFPQYLSYLLTGKIVADYTYLGCHTAMWDFDNMQYHPWLAKEGIELPEPVSSSTCYPVNINGKTVQVGVGIHDSSASLVPYFKKSNDPFILFSTGTWMVIMNPFNNESLTSNELKNDILCYLSTDRKQVKSALLFLGHLHNVNLTRITEYFKAATDEYKKVQPDSDLLRTFEGKEGFFSNGIPNDYIDYDIDLNQFGSFSEAYQRLVYDFTRLTFEGFKRIIPATDNIKTVYVSGGFNRNPIFIYLLNQWLPHKEVKASEVKNATAMGAAMVIK
jgi:sugar (pentulose or hexulose) kinase